MIRFDDRSLLMSALWMVGISLILFFLPPLNGVVGGMVGGYKAGSLGRALGAAVLPAIVAGVVLWGLLALADAPVVGFLAGVAGTTWALLASIGMLIGAAIGGAVSPSRSIA